MAALSALELELASFRQQRAREVCRWRLKLFMQSFCWSTSRSKPNERLVSTHRGPHQPRRSDPQPQFCLAHSSDHPAELDAQLASAAQVPTSC